MNRKQFETKKAELEVKKAELEKVREEIAEIERQSTLLEKFMFKELRDYREPKRKGKKKGELIGLSRIKFKASLLMMKDLEHKQIAELLSVSLGVIRNWRTEGPFKEVFISNCLKFARDYVTSVEEMETKEDAGYNIIPKLSIHDVAGYQPPYIIHDYFKEVHIYHPYLKGVIAELLLRKLEARGKDFGFSMVCYAFVSHLSISRKKPEVVATPSELVRDLIGIGQEAKKAIRKNLYRLVRETLLELNAPEEERKKALIVLNMIESADWYRR